MTEFIAVGLEEQTGRHLFTVKSSTIGKQNDQVGVYLDTCTAIITINTAERFWIFWMAPDSEAENSPVKGHSVSGKKTPEERDTDVLIGFRNDLKVANFPARHLYAVNSLPEAKKVLTDSLGVAPKGADAIILYLIRFQ